MKIEQINNNIILTDISNFHLKKTFECGQCFRWNEVNENEYEGIIKDRVVKIKQENNRFIFYDVSREFFDTVLVDYFSFNEDYERIDKLINTDSHIDKCIKYGNGIRLLKQDLFETIISFIISSNNNIPRIKKIINDICKNYGGEIKYNNKIYYSFPTPDSLAKASLEDLFNLKMGYRNKYIFDAAQKISSKEIDLNKIENMETTAAKEELMKIKGIGQKVADCILLFSLKRYELCPQDVWVKKIFKNRYNLTDLTFEKGFNLAKSKWGEYAGIAQQYLFYYERENGE